MIFEKQKKQNKIKDSTIKNSIANFLVDNMTYKSLVYIVMLILISSINIMGLYPGIYIMLAIATIFNIPLLISMVFTGISILIFKLPIEVFNLYIVTFVLYTIINSLINIEGISKRFVTLLKLGLSMFSAIILIGIFKQTDLRYLSKSISNIFLVMTGYIIFVVGANCIFNYNKKMIYGREEFIATSIMISIVLLFTININMFGVSIWQYVLAIIVLITGYFGGWLSGGIMGIISALLIILVNKNNQLEILQNIEELYTILFFTIMGITSGLNRTKNKIIVVITNIFIIVLIEYIFYREAGLCEISFQMLIATMFLIFLPRKYIYKLKNIFDKNETLKSPYEKELGPGIDVLDRQGAMSEVFESLSEIILEPAEEYLKETEIVIKKYLTNYAKNECTRCYKKLECKKEGKRYNVEVVAKTIAIKLENNEDIKEDIIGNNCINAMEILRETKDIYNNMKLMRIIKAKEKESSINSAQEYKQMSHAIKQMVKSNVKRTNKKDTSNSELELKIIKENLELSGYIVYEADYKKENNSKEYEFVTDIIENSNKVKEKIMQIISESIKEKMYIKVIVNSSKNEKSTIKLVSKNV